MNTLTLHIGDVVTLKEDLDLKIDKFFRSAFAENSRSLERISGKKVRIVNITRRFWSCKEGRAIILGLLCREEVNPKDRPVVFSGEDYVYVPIEAINRSHCLIRDGHRILMYKKNLIV